MRAAKIRSKLCTCPERRDPKERAQEYTMDTLFKIGGGDSNWNTEFPSFLGPSQSLSVLVSE